MNALRKDSKGKDEYSIEDDGWDARIQGVSKSDNPFGINNWKYYDWEKGWLLADDPLKKAESNN
jgi:hypothetical protein